jgi:glyceraldehyde-3-phosphate dehydrogenase/erythrose-4-phosphate dehydrogenase
VLQIAENFRKEMMAFGVTDHFFVETKNESDNFTKKIVGSISQRSENSLRLESIGDEFKNMMSVLEGMDRAVNVLIQANPDFYKSYTKARYLGTGNAKKVSPTTPATPVKTPTVTTTTVAPAALLEKTTTNVSTALLPLEGQIFNRPGLG